MSGAICCREVQKKARAFDIDLVALPGVDSTVAWGRAEKFVVENDFQVVAPVHTHLQMLPKRVLPVVKVRVLLCTIRFLLAARRRSRPGVWVGATCVARVM